MPRTGFDCRNGRPCIVVRGQTRLLLLLLLLLTSISITSIIVTSIIITSMTNIIIIVALLAWVSKRGGGQTGRARVCLHIV